MAQTKRLAESNRVLTLWAFSEDRMMVYVLLREDQSEHGYIDTSIAGVFLDERPEEQDVTRVNP